MAEQFPQILRELRQQRQMSQRDVAEQIYICCQSIQRYERGYSEPNMTTLGLLADFFDVSVDYLMGRDHNANQNDL